MQRKTYQGRITSLEPNQILCFGSNTQGRHGKSMALQAMNFGAKYGQACGLQGQTYAIITKDLTKKIHPSIPEEMITKQIIELYKFARDNEDLEFLIGYSGSGVNLNAYSPQDMARMFSVEIPPKNIVFEENFNLLIS